MIQISFINIGNSLVIMKSKRKIYDTQIIMRLSLNNISKAKAKHKYREKSIHIQIDRLKCI